MDDDEDLSADDTGSDDDYGDATEDDGDDEDYGDDAGAWGDGDGEDSTSADLYDQWGQDDTAGDDPSANSVETWGYGEDNQPNAAPGDADASGNADSGDPESAGPKKGGTFSWVCQGTGQHYDKKDGFATREAAQKAADNHNKQHGGEAGAIVFPLNDE